MLVGVETVRHSPEELAEALDLLAPLCFGVLRCHLTGPVPPSEIQPPDESVFPNLSATFEKINKLEVQIDLHTRFQKISGFFGWLAFRA